MEKQITKFVMYSGLRTIGGVVASLEYGKDRVVFEFGAAYDPKTDIFDRHVERRRQNWIRDSLRLGILPRMDGIYRREDLGNSGLISAEESDYNTAVFITHLHLDHMASIGAVAPQIPVYMHHNAQIIERALEATGEGVETIERGYSNLLPDQAVRVGKIEVLPLLCNGESYMDFAFLITTPDGTLYYTGDLTLHGSHAALVFRQMERMRELRVDVMMCDCTAFMDDTMRLMYGSGGASIQPSPDVPQGMLCEGALYEQIFTGLKDKAGLWVFNYYQREMADAKRFMDWAKTLGRTCVFEPDAAYIVHRFFGLSPAVYVPDSKRYDAAPAWFRELAEHCELVSAKDIHANPGGYILQNSYRHILELFDLPAQDGVYIHADGIPIGPFDPAWANMRRLVDSAGFDYVTFFNDHYFGHGYPCQVKYFVDQINPKVLIPCHSYHPERLLPKDGVQLLPEPYKTYILRDHALVPENERGAP